MIFGDLEGLKLPDIRLTGEEKPRKNLTQEIYPDRGSNPGPLREKRACYRFVHGGGPKGRSFTASAGTKAAILLRINSCGNFPLLSAPHSLFHIRTVLKNLKRF